MEIRIKKQQNKDIGLKPLNVFDYLESLSQEAKDLMDEIKDADNDIDIYKLVFIGSNRETFSFNIFKKPLNFISAVYNSEIKRSRNFSKKCTEKNRGNIKYNYNITINQKM